MTRHAAAPAAAWGLPGLGADGPDPARADKLRLFGQFVGDWDLERRWIDPDGSERRNTGHVYFRWILGGRAVQDVWTANEGDPPAETPVGTTIRFYDVQADVWTSHWISPEYDVLARFTVRQIGDEIVLETSEREGQAERWIFSELTPASFRWRAEESLDGGTSWTLTEEMRVRRRS